MTSVLRTFLTLLLISGLTVLPAGGADDGPALRERGVLTLINGDALSGEFLASDSSEWLRWQGEAFLDPFEFETGALSSIRFPTVEPNVRAEGEFAVELADGSVLTGRITRWSEDEVGLDSPHFGTLQLRGGAIRRLYRIDENPLLVFNGPSGLEDWKASNRDWREDGPHLWTDKDAAMLTGDLDLPDRAVVEFELSWSRQANFVFSIGADPNVQEDKRQDGWRFEAWGAGDEVQLNRDNRVDRFGGGVFRAGRRAPAAYAGSESKEEGGNESGGVLSVVREQREIADVEVVQALSQETKRVHLITYLNQEEGTLHVFHLDGTAAGKITLPPDEPPGERPRGSRRGRGIRLINRHGEIRLERLRIARWSGSLPSRDDGQSRFELADGTAVTGRIVALQSETQEFLIRTADRDRTVAMQDLVSAELPNKADSEDNAVSAILQDGTRLSGTISAIGAEELVLVSPDFSGALRVPHAKLRLLAFRNRAAAEIPRGAQEERRAQKSDSSGRSGRLEIGDHSLRGRLVPAGERADASCLAWQPEGSRTSSPLKPDIAGRVVYRDPPPGPEKGPAGSTDPNPVGRQRPGGNFATIFLKKAAEPPARRSLDHAHTIYLRSGDAIPCTVKGVDGEGVHMTSSVAGTQVIPHEKIKAAELSQGALPPDLQAAKKERLLTLSRLQKASPPTHLICSRTGDFLRCRLIDMNEERIRIELHLDEIEIPRDRVSQLIWFHADELEGEDAEREGETEGEGPRTLAASGHPPVSPSPLLAQALRPNGNRVTFVPREVEGNVVVGTSDVLGICRIELDEVDQLIFGKEIEVAAAELAYHRWRLRPAVEPLVAQDFEESGSEAGTVSPLVGEPAPEIDLEFLEGGRFKLSQFKGRIVVIDFWASWCGPCMQTMPLIEEAMKQFDPEQVRLISVNLEEPAARVKSVLARYRLEVSVALDVDGVAARRYQANAIPQLVIVDREGNVARLYVGGGARVVEQLKQTVQEMLE